MMNQIYGLFPYSQQIVACTVKTGSHQLVMATSAQTSARLNYLTSELARPGHPDKLADQVSDAILDALIAQDPFARGAIESLLKGNTCTLAGEITSRAEVDLQSVVTSVLGVGLTVPVTEISGV